MFRFFKRQWGYPECEHLNIALRRLLEAPFVDEYVVEEICFAIAKAGGYFRDDVKQMLIEENLWNF